MNLETTHPIGTGERLKLVEAECKAFEQALRICIWNDCKRLGQSDDNTYRRINATIEGVRAKARAEQSA